MVCPPPQDIHLPSILTISYHNWLPPVSVFVFFPFLTSSSSYVREILHFSQAALYLFFLLCSLPTTCPIQSLTFLLVPCLQPEKLVDQPWLLTMARFPLLGNNVPQHILNSFFPSFLSLRPDDIKIILCLW